MTDAELDAALVALTAVDVDPAFAGRVLRAIEDAGAERPRWTPRLVPAFAGIGTALVVVAAGLTWRAAQPVMLPPAAAAPRLIVADARLPREVTSGPGVATPLQVRRTPPVMTEPDSAHVLPALDPVEPVAIDRLRHSPIEREELGIEPLSIAQLAVETLDR